MNRITPYQYIILSNNAKCQEIVQIVVILPRINLALIWVKKFVRREFVQGVKKMHIFPTLCQRKGKHMHPRNKKRNERVSVML